MQQPRRLREAWAIKRTMLKDRKSHRLQREKDNRIRYARPADLGRTLCYRGNRVIVMSQDFNLFPDKQLGLSIFAYLFQGINSWDMKWQRRDAFERFGRWVLAVHGDTRLAN
jgi:hypothetical protein